jgi:phosphate transport system substrate-binding protein
LGFRYEWVSDIVGEWSLRPFQEDIPEEYPNFFDERIKVSQTHGAFMNLIDNNVDIILTHRTLSPDEQAHAEELGVTLIETPVALDAFVFLVNKDNPVQSLTVNQIQDIYTGTTTNWQQVGGNDAMIRPFTRPRNSGSEEVMRSLVMNGLEIGDFPAISEIVMMAGVFPEMRNTTDAISYTFNFYKDVMVRVPDEDVPKIKVNGIFPDENTVKSKTYPFVAQVHVAIRSDLDINSTAYKLYEWLQSEAGKAVIAESGYLPESSPNSIPEIVVQGIQIYPNPAKNDVTIRLNSNFAAQSVEIFDISGRVVARQTIDNHAGSVIPLALSELNIRQSGIYLVKVIGKTGSYIQRLIVRK